MRVAAGVMNEHPFTSIHNCWSLKKANNLGYNFHKLIKIALFQQMLTPKNNYFIILSHSQTHNQWYIKFFNLKKVCFYDFKYACESLLRVETL